MSAAVLEEPVALRVHAPRDLRIETFEPAPLAPDMVRVRFLAGGICGSDMHYFAHARNGDFAVTEPLTLGHEIAGEIAAVGAAVAGLAPGQRVAVNPSRSCGACARCREGRHNLCENGYFMGSASRQPHMQGGFASLFDVRPEQCLPVPDGVNIEAAALAEPLAVCLHAVGRAGRVAGAAVLVVGAGPIGLLTALAARHEGAASVTITDLRPAALAVAETLGLRTAAAGTPLPSGVDIAFEAAGAGAALDSAIRAVRRGGTVVQIGNIAGAAPLVPMNLVVAKELDLKGSQRFGTAFARALDLIVSGAIDPTAIVGARFPLRQVHAALDQATNPERAGAKIMLVGDGVTP